MSDQQENLNPPKAPRTAWFSDADYAIILKVSEKRKWSASQTMTEMIRESAMFKKSEEEISDEQIARGIKK